MHHLDPPNREILALALQGCPATEISETALREKCDLIAMATHGRTGLAHVLLGSVADARGRAMRLDAGGQRRIDACDRRVPWPA